MSSASWSNCPASRSTTRGCSTTPTSRRRRCARCGERIAPAAELILPSMHLDVVAFGCTSASMALGEAEVFRQIHSARPKVACTTPVTAAFAAFKALGARRIGVLTPYAPEVNAVVRDYLNAHGAEVAAFATFDKRDDREAARISVDSIAEAIAALARAHATGRGVRVVHQPAPGGTRGGDRGGGGNSGYLQRPRAGLALPAARRRERLDRRRRPSVRLQLIRAALSLHGAHGQAGDHVAAQRVVHNDRRQ